MYSRILFAVDDDEALPAAVPVVAAYARRWAAEVRVLHVHRVGPDVPDASSQRLVDAVVERLRAVGVSASGEVRLVKHGEKVAPIIAGAATQAEADMVAVGSRGRSDLGALFLGSVSHEVAGGLQVPVLVVRASSFTSAAPHTVLVAVDGSAGSDEAVVEAAEVASEFGASVLVVHVRRLTAVEGVTAIEPEEDARGIVSRAVEGAEARGVRASGEILVDSSVVASLVSAAERHAADLVVLGSRRPSHLGGLVLGSVAHEVVHRLPCPVLLARLIPATESVG
jgi:nucleotide-binding universal stress UspA family protein